MATTRGEAMSDEEKWFINWRALERACLRGALYLAIPFSLNNLAANPIASPICLVVALAGLAASSRAAD
jgi:hypothetical protein